MSDSILRIVVAGAIIAASGAVGLLAARWSRPSHPAVDLDGLGLPPGIVMFTATDCATCKEARARAEVLGLPLREVTHELEGALFARAGVEAVPLTAFVDGNGKVVAQFVGVPRRGALRHAAGAARSG